MLSPSLSPKHLDTKYIFFFKNLVLFLTVLDLCCCVGFSPVVARRGSSPVVGFSWPWPLLFCCRVWARGLAGFGSCRSQAQEHRVNSCVHRLSYSAACRVLLDQRLNLCLLHWRVDSFPLSHQGSSIYSNDNSEQLVVNVAHKLLLYKQDNYGVITHHYSLTSYILVLLIYLQFPSTQGVAYLLDRLLQESRAHVQLSVPGIRSCFSPAPQLRQSS